MEGIVEQFSHIYSLNHFLLTMIVLITMVLVARTVVAGDQVFVHSHYCCLRTSDGICHGGK